MSLKVIENFTYLSFFGLGIYFIIEGGVLHRFIKKRTDYSGVEEPITELPTITTYISGQHPNLKYGIDFNISFEATDFEEQMRSNYYINYKHTILHFGENAMRGSPLKVYTESYWYHGNTFKITPINFESGMSANYNLRYIFSNTTDVQKVSVRLTTDDDYKINSEAFSNKVFECVLKETNQLSVMPQKIIRLKSLGCQEKPHNTLFVETLLQKLQVACKKPCRQSPNKFRFGVTLDQMLDHLPKCSRVTQRYCYYQAWKNVSRQIQNNKPCKKILYKAEETHFSTQPKNQAMFKILFPSPPKIDVQEEYLIYDAVAMVSSIGGTLGLCIGFSFYDLSKTFLGWLGKMLKNVTSLNKVQEQDNNRQNILQLLLKSQKH